MKVYLNIGTNLGDRAENIEQAIKAIEQEFNCATIRSDVIETDAWGYLSDNKFLNIGIAIDIELPPIEILSIIKDIEKRQGSASHRTYNGDYADRIIDIDIMDIEGVKMDTKQLCIPHRHLEDRIFFIEPYRQLLTITGYGLK